jgi:GNAT superfamily N-acetyltransferase
VISIPALEAAAAGGWRPAEEAALGGWLLRAAGGFTGRANSALAVGDPGLPLAAAIEKVRAWYQARSLPPMIATAFPLGRPQENGADRFLEERGWSIRPGPATVMTAAPGAIARLAGAIRVDMSGQPDDGWLALYHYRGQPLPPIAGRLLMSAPWQAFASVRTASQTVAIGRVAVAAEWAGLTAVEVHREHRRRGLATAITAALATAAAARGVTGIYLQVEDGNAAARALYRRAGFADHHGYHYRVAPGNGRPGWHVASRAEQAG